MCVDARAVIVCNGQWQDTITITLQIVFMKNQVLLINASEDIWGRLLVSQTVSPHKRPALRTTQVIDLVKFQSEVGYIHVHTAQLVTRMHTTQEYKSSYICVN